MVVCQVVFTKPKSNWSKTTLNYWKMVERYPNLKEEVSVPFPAMKSSLYLTKKQTSQVVNCLLCFGAHLLTFRLKKKQTNLKVFVCLVFFFWLVRVTFHHMGRFIYTKVITREGEGRKIQHEYCIQNFRNPLFPGTAVRDGKVS